MTQDQIQKVKDILNKYVLKHKDYNNSKLAELALKENPKIGISHRSLRNYVSLLRTELAAVPQPVVTPVKIIESPKKVVKVVDEVIPLPEAPPEPMVETVFDEEYMPETIDHPIVVSAAELVLNKYGVANNKFHLIKKGNNISLDTVMVDRAFCAYSRKGLNLTSHRVMQLLGLTSDEFSAITYHLNLNKESNPYSAYSEYSMSYLDLNVYLQDNTKFLLDILHQDDHGASVQVIKSYKEVIVKQKNFELSFEALANELKDILPKIKITGMRDKTPKGVEHMHVFIPDMHIGLDLVNYNYDIVSEKLAEVLSHINDTDSPVHVHFMGDIIHSVSGMNHPDSWKDMAVDGHGANAITRPFEILAEFLIAIDNLAVVNMVGGELIASNFKKECI